MIRLYLGRKERGKTTLAYFMAAKVPRRLIIDSRGDIRRPGAVVARSAGALQRACDALADGEVHEVVYVPRESLRDAWRAFAAEVRGWIDARRSVPLAVLVDELTFFDCDLEDFHWSLKCCRASATHFFLTCHRPTEVPVSIRAISDYWYLFQASQEHDLEVIEARCGAEVAALVSRLVGSQFVCWNDRDGSYTVNREPASWFVQLAPGRPAVPPVELD